VLAEAESLSNIRLLTIGGLTALSPRTVPPNGKRHVEGET
jgi:hypothetical protein